MGAHVLRGALGDLGPQLLVIGGTVAQAAGDGELDDVREGAARRQQGRLPADRTGLLQDHAEVLRAGIAQRLEDEELGVGLGAAGVLGRLRAPGAQPDPAGAAAVAVSGRRTAQLLLTGLLGGQLEGGGAGQCLHPLPAAFPVVAGGLEQGGRRAPVVRPAHFGQCVIQLLIRTRQPYVELLQRYEAVAGHRVGGHHHALPGVLYRPPAAHPGQEDEAAERERGEEKQQSVHVGVLYLKFLLRLPCWSTGPGRRRFPVRWGAPV
uniref:Uncharacterized protein n=1 Tax=Streptomyces auratus AGR0001 TaxID=1160718 RepID=J1S8G9_9ACTN